MLNPTMKSIVATNEILVVLKRSNCLDHTHEILQKALEAKSCSSSRFQELDIRYRY
jgi:hypothetical protein